MIETKILAEVNNLRKDKKYRVATNESQNLTIRPELAGEARKIPSGGGSRTQLEIWRRQIYLFFNSILTLRSLSLWYIVNK